MDQINIEKTKKIIKCLEEINTIQGSDYYNFSFFDAIEPTYLFSKDFLDSYNYKDVLNIRNSDVSCSEYKDEGATFFNRLTNKSKKDIIKCAIAGPNIIDKIFRNIKNVTPEEIDDICDLYEEKLRIIDYYQKNKDDPNIDKNIFWFFNKLEYGTDSTITYRFVRNISIEIFTNETMKRLLSRISRFDPTLVFCDVKNIYRYFYRNMDIKEYYDLFANKDGSNTEVINDLDRLFKNFNYNSDEYSVQNLLNDSVYTILNAKKITHKTLDLFKDKNKISLDVFKKVIDKIATYKDGASKIKYLVSKRYFSANMNTEFGKSNALCEELSYIAEKFYKDLDYKFIVDESSTSKFTKYRLASSISSCLTHFAFELFKHDHNKYIPMLYDVINNRPSILNEFVYFLYENFDLELLKNNDEYRAIIFKTISSSLDYDEHLSKIKEIIFNKKHIEDEELDIDELIKIKDTKGPEAVKYILNDITVGINYNTMYMFSRSIYNRKYTPTKDKTFISDFLIKLFKLKKECGFKINFDEYAPLTIYPDYIQSNERRVSYYPGKNEVETLLATNDRELITDIVNSIYVPLTFDKLYEIAHNIQESIKGGDPTCEIFIKSFRNEMRGRLLYALDAFNQLKEYITIRPKETVEEYEKILIPYWKKLYLIVSLG